MKISLPIAGLIGTLVSGVVVSASNYRSLKAAGEYVTHNWKIKVDEISVEVGCKGRMIHGKGSVDSTDSVSKLKWTIKTGNNEEKKIIAGEEVSSQSEVGLWTAEGGKPLWNIVDYERASRTAISLVEKDGKLNVELKELWGPKGDQPGPFPIGTFTCEANVHKKDTQKAQVYKAKLEALREKEVESIITEDPVPFQVRLSTCTWFEDKKQFVCGLKVTGGSDLGWNTDVNAKARISFE